jgi:hypothetical protein
MAFAERSQENHRNAGLGPSSWNQSPEFHISGCQSEFAVSIYLNLYWRPYIGVVRAIDVGGVVNVRSTKHLDRGHLLIKPADAMVPTVLVLQHNSVFRLRGWMHATDAKKNYPLQQKFGDPAHWVPQGDLHDMKTLKRGELLCVPSTTTK